MPPGPIRSCLTSSAVVAALCLAGCGGGSGESTGSAADADGSGAAGGAASAAGPAEPRPTTTPAGGDARSRILRTVHLYVDSLNSGDGAKLCSLLAPGALRAIHLPSPRSGCAESLRASIGHPSPTGSPRWLGTRLVGADSVVIVDGRLGRFTGTVVHRFAGSREPSIEDDVIYLRQVGGRWLIVKPSATFHRAIGARDVPITALTPP